MAGHFRDRRVALHQSSSPTSTRRSPSTRWTRRTNLKKYGGFIPGVRPGRPTAGIPRTGSSARLTFPGASVPSRRWRAASPAILSPPHPPETSTFGGTSILIVIGVALETMKQLEAQLMMRSYEGLPSSNSPAPRRREGVAGDLPRATRTRPAVEAGSLPPVVSELNLITAGPAGCRQGHGQARSPTRGPSRSPPPHLYGRHPARHQVAEGYGAGGARRKSYMDAGRARARRGDHRDDHRAHRPRVTRPRRLPAGPAFPATKSRPTRSDGRSRGLERRLTCGGLLIEVPDADVIPPARRPAGCASRTRPTSTHVDFDPPKHEGVCDQDGARLVQAAMTTARRLIRNAPGGPTHAQDGSR